MNKQNKEKPLDYFLRMLIEKQIRFSDLVAIYVEYLEQRESKQRGLIVDGAIISSVLKNKNIWQGTKKQLKEKIETFLEESDVFRY